MTIAIADLRESNPCPVWCPEADSVFAHDAHRKSVRVNGRADDESVEIETWCQVIDGAPSDVVILHLDSYDEIADFTPMQARRLGFELLAAADRLDPEGTKRLEPGDA